MYHRPNAGNIYRPNTRDMFLNLSRRVILKYAPTQSQTGNAANNTENCIIVIMISFSVCMFFCFYLVINHHGGNYAEYRRRGF